MAELPKYECHLCLEAGRKNWKQRCPWALKLAETLIYHRNLNVALDLKLAKSELLQKNLPGPSVSLKVCGDSWQCWDSQVKSEPANCQSNTIKPSNATFSLQISPFPPIFYQWGFPSPTISALTLQDHRKVWTWGISCKWLRVSACSFQGFCANATKPLCRESKPSFPATKTSVQGMQTLLPSQGPAAYLVLSLP